MEEHVVFTAQTADALEAEEILFSFIFPGHFLRKSRCPHGYQRTCVCNAETPKHFAYFDVSETLDFSGINAAFHNVHHLHHSNGISQWHTRYDPRRPATGLRRQDSVFTIKVYGGFNFTWVTTTDYTLILMWVSRLHPILGSLTTIVDG